MLGYGLSLTFRECNLRNCVVPQGTVVDDCNCSQVDYCYWLHPEYTLTLEDENCRHVVGTDNVTIDGQVASTTYHRKDTVL